MLDDRERDEEVEFETLEGEGRKRSPLPAAIILLAVVAGAVALFFLPKGEKKEEAVVVMDRPPAVEAPASITVPVPEPEPAVPAVTEAKVAPAEEEASAVEPLTPPVPDEPLATGLPPLDESGELVRGLLTGCLGSDLPREWLDGGNLIRLFVVIVDNVAEGASPRPHLGFLRFAGDFAVYEREGLPYIDPAGYGRYDGIARFFDSFDPAFCAGAYRRVQPLVEEAYRDLGYPDRPFEGTLRRAIGRIVEVTVPREDALLIPGEGAYHYEDPAIESLSDIAKQILRMGPANAEIVQRALRDFADAL